MDIVEAPAARQRRFADENEAIAARLVEIGVRHDGGHAGTSYGFGADGDRFTATP